MVVIIVVVIVSGQCGIGESVAYCRDRNEHDGEAIHFLISLK
jgi:hypothetical protein